VVISETAPARDSAQLKDSVLAFAASPWALVAVLAAAVIAYARFPLLASASRAR